MWAIAAGLPLVIRDIAVETEYGRTVTVHRFEIAADPPESDMKLLDKRF